MLTPQNSTVCLRVCFFGCILLFENVYETPDSLGIVMTIFFFNLIFLPDTDSHLCSLYIVMLFTYMRPNVKKKK